MEPLTTSTASKKSIKSNDLLFKRPSKESRPIHVATNKTFFVPATLCHSNKTVLNKTTPTARQKDYNRICPTVANKFKTNKIIEPIPRDKTCSKAFARKLNEPLKKQNKTLINIGINTIVTGSLKTFENDGVTMVRKRDYHNCSCKCTSKHSFITKTKSRNKLIQTTMDKTNNYSDKACAYRVEAASRSTQFSCNICGSKSKHNRGPTLRQYFDIKESNNDKQDCLRGPSIGSTLNAKRWALSKYPTRGPDF